MIGHLLSRRRFQSLLVSLSAILPAPKLLAATPEMSTPGSSFRALGSYLDTILPSDATPSATELGVDEAVIALARKNRSFSRFISDGCVWLDAQAAELGAEEFSVLDENARETVVRHAEQSPKNSLPGAFFHKMRDLAFSHYYSHPASWQGLGYAGPPQPNGFPDHTQPPLAP